MRGEIKFAAWLGKVEEALNQFKQERVSDIDPEFLLDEHKSEESKESEDSAVDFGDYYLQQCIDRYLEVIAILKPYAKNPLGLVAESTEPGSTLHNIYLQLRSIDRDFYVPRLFHLRKEGNDYQMVPHRDCYDLAKMLRGYYAWMSECDGGLVYKGVKVLVGERIDSVLFALDERLYFFEYDLQNRYYRQQHQSFNHDLIAFVESVSVLTKFSEKNLEEMEALLNRCLNLHEASVFWFSRGLFDSETARELYDESVTAFFQQHDSEGRYALELQTLNHVSCYSSEFYIQEFEKLALKFKLSEKHPQRFAAMQRTLAPIKEKFPDENKQFGAYFDSWAAQVFAKVDALFRVLDDHRHCFSGFTFMKSDQKSAFKAWVKDLYMLVGKYRQILGDYQTIRGVQPLRRDMIEVVIGELMTEISRHFEAYSKDYKPTLGGGKSPSAVEGAMLSFCLEMKPLKTFECYYKKQDNLLQEGSSNYEVATLNF